MLKKYFLRKALRKALVNISSSGKLSTESCTKTFDLVLEHLIDLSMSQDEIQMRVGLNTALMADCKNLKLGKARLQVEIQALEATKKSLEKDLQPPIETHIQNG